MSTVYLIQIWYKEKRRYVDSWVGTDKIIAMRMYDNPYYTRRTRRLIEIDTEIIYQNKGKK